MRNEYNTTTHSRVYNILHKEVHAQCSHCTWHSRWFNKYNENDSWNYYCIDDDPNERFNMTKFPNWKLCSKNKKQWMKKPLKYRKKHYVWSGRSVYYIEW